MFCQSTTVQTSRTSAQDADQKMFANCGTAYKDKNLGSQSLPVTF